MVAENIIEFFTRPILGLWELVLWLVRTWCELIVSVLSLLGWLLAFAGVLLLVSGAFMAGAVAYAVALLFMAFGHFFRLADLWISDKRYSVSPEAFVGDVVGTVIGFFLIFGLLLAIWFFLFPAQWLLVIIVALAPISALDSASRIAKNFLATIKDKITPRQVQPQQGGVSPGLLNLAKDVAQKAAEVAKPKQKGK